MSKTSTVKRFSTGENNPRWNGGRTIDKDGYIHVKSIGHHAANSLGYVLEHRLVYEKFHKCCLLPWILIHHKNKNRQDNRIENLEPLTKLQHQRHHNKLDMSERFCFICKGKTRCYGKSGNENWYRHPITKQEWLCNNCYRVIKRKIL